MDVILRAEQQATDLILKAAREAFPEHTELPAFSVEKPANAAFGDLSVNAAMVWARSLSAAPRVIAQQIIDKSVLTDTYFDTITVAGAGFINFTYSPEFYRDVLKAALTEGADYGRSERMKGQKMMVEFVSANPTGPMHMGNARGGAVGDVLAELLDRCGADVTREFYVNDSGNQIERFGLSLEARYLQHFGVDAPVPEDGYHGDDIKERAEEYIALHGDDVLNVEPQARIDALVGYALEKNIDIIQKTLGGYRIDYDVWFRESSLYRDKITDKVISILTEKGLTYEKDGALWYAASVHSPEDCPEDKKLKDEVLIRTNGNCTYFAADAAYHYNKFALRGFDKVINVWGADHHGHIARLKYILDDLGVNGSENLEIVLIQLVRLMQDGKPVKMSKRTGKAISLADLLDETSVDAARFFFNMKTPATGMDFDLDLAIEQSAQNPIFYVQSAHARICSLIATLAEDGYTLNEGEIPSADKLVSPEEKALLSLIAELPSAIYDGAESRDPSGMTHYATTLASAFHSFYNAHRIRSGEKELILPRLALVTAVRRVLANVLEMLKVEAPEKM